VSVLKIRVLGDPVLRLETKPVPVVTDDVRRLIDDMFDTMYAANGIGLAAPQVGRTERVAVVDVDGAKYALVNPQIVVADGPKEKTEEGCLSIPDIYADVERPTHVVIKALDRDGTEFEAEATGLLGRCFQHEIDHLHGKLFLDHLSFIKRKSAMAKWEREKDQYPGFIRILTPGKKGRGEHPEEEL
jgi:peptide deformylase